MDRGCHKASPGLEWNVDKAIHTQCPSSQTARQTEKCTDTALKALWEYTVVLAQ